MQNIAENFRRIDRWEQSFHEEANCFYAILARYSSEFWKIPESPAPLHRFVRTPLSRFVSGQPWNSDFPRKKKLVSRCFQWPWFRSSSSHCSRVAAFPPVNKSSSFSFSSVFSFFVLFSLVSFFFLSRFISLASYQRYQDSFRGNDVSARIDHKNKNGHRGRSNPDVSQITVFYCTPIARHWSNFRRGKTTITRPISSFTFSLTLSSFPTRLA